MSIAGLRKHCLLLPLRFLLSLWVFGWLLGGVVLIRLLKNEKAKVIEDVCITRIGCLMMNVNSVALVSIIKGTDGNAIKLEAGEFEIVSPIASTIFSVEEIVDWDAGMLTFISNLGEEEYYDFSEMTESGIAGDCGEWLEKIKEVRVKKEI